ncbi:MAG: sulfotransferase [Marinoscillum sp.]
MKRIKLARILLHFAALLPKKHPVWDSKWDGGQPFFVFGSGRNGSTLLNRILNQHSQLFLPPEQYFLGPSIIKYSLYNFMIWRDLVKVIAGELIQTSKSHNWHIQEFPDLRSIFLWPKEERSLQRLINEIFLTVNYDKKQLWGDTTHLNTNYAPEIVKVYPNGKYFFLIRDGRDVVASFKKGGPEIFEDRSNPIVAANQWINSIKMYEYLKRKVDLKLIRYEELVTAPEVILQEVCGKIGVPFEQGMLRFHDHIPEREIYQQEIHENLRKPISARSIGSYQEILSDVELAQIMPIIKSGLKQFDYL